MIDPDLPTKIRNPPSEHPYQKFVKPTLASRLKYSHNSIYANPVYPVKAPKQRRKQGQRTKFTIYGISSIPEFNYCVQIAQGLHRCRPHIFDAPDKQAITCVDWPKVWTDLKVRFGGIVYCIQSSVVILINGNLLGGKPEFEQYIQTRYNYYLCFDYYKLAVDSFIRFVRSSGKPHAYMHITIDDEVIGTFIFRLNSDILPSTCDNFLRLCNATRGGYGGTPIHRIVKDNWIQCGGYGLKNNPNLDCENFMVPHDKRGVLGMANDGRNCDCSTQFFVLLQPSPWMACKYVAFGQLIDGEQTLAKIEKVPTFYESPLRNIVIAKAGILNLEATDVVISPGTTEYIDSHIEDLVILGGVALGWLMQRLDLEIQMIEVSKLMAQGEGEYLTNEGASAAVRNAERFMRTKGKDQVAEADWRDEQVPSEGAQNEDFDVEEYEYAYEEEVIYKQVTPPASVDARPTRPYYIPLTDVPYPGEKDSTYDLKKFLTGDYCLESDLGPNTTPRRAIRFDPSQVERDDEPSQEPQDALPEGSVYSLDSDDRSEIRRYLRNNSDHVSFAGGIVSRIANGSKEYVNIFDEPRRVDERTTKARRVSLAVLEGDEKPDNKVKRRQTGFVQLSSSEMEEVSASQMVKLALGLGDSGDGQSRHVRIADAERRSTLESLMTPKQHLSGAGPRSAFVRGGAATGDSERPLCVMKRLYDLVTLSDTTAPTLKNYRPFDEPRDTGLMLTQSIHQLHREDSIKSKIHRAQDTQESVSIEQMLTMQHGKRFARKISSDYVKTIDKFEQPVAVSLRSLEYAKTRPKMSVAEYQARNDAYKEGLRRAQAEEIAATVHAGAKAATSSVKVENKMEIPEIFSATTASLLGEEERLGEDLLSEQGNFDEKFAVSIRDQVQVTSAYEKTTKTEVTVEEHKTVKTYMDPPQVFNTRSTTSTNAVDERDELTSGGNDPGADVSTIVSRDSLKH